MPLISVITPCFEAELFIAEMAESVLRQSLTDWELIVVDDGSTDRSREIAEGYAHRDSRVSVFSQNNRGVASARNAGFREAHPSSRYVLFLDADDVLEPGMLARATAYLEARTEVGIVHVDLLVVDELGRAMPHVRYTPRYVPSRLGISDLPAWEPVTPFESIFTLAHIVPSCCVWRRAVLQAAGPWDETFGQHYEDTDMLLRGALQAPVHLLPESLVRYRRHQGSSSADLSRFGPQERKLYERWRDDADLLPGQREIVRQARRFRERRVVPVLGLRAARHHLGIRDVRGAIRFAGGAAKSLLRSVASGGR